MIKNMGQRIREKREEEGLSREDLAVWLGVSRQTIYKWENGKVKNIDRDFINRMAARWQCEPDWLMAFEKPDDREPVSLAVDWQPPGSDSGSAKLRAQLYKVAIEVKPENLAAAIEILKSLS